MMNSSRFTRTKKIAERMLEIENEVKKFHNYSDEIIKMCSDLVERMKDIGDVEAFLDEYASAYRYLSSCAASFSEFNCKMEILRLGNEVTPSFFQISTKPVNQTVIGTRGIEKLESTSGKGERTISVDSINPPAFAKGNRLEKTRSNFSENTGGISDSVKKLNSFEVDENSSSLGMKKEELTERSKANVAFTEESMQSTQHSKCTQNLGNESNRTVKNCSDIVKETSFVEFTKTINKDAVPPALPQVPDPASPVPAAVSSNNTCFKAEETRENPVCKPSFPREGLSYEVCIRRGKGIKVAEGKSETSNVEKSGKFGNLGALKIDREVGVVHDVILSHLVSPDEFYVYVKCEELELFDELKKKLSSIGGELDGNEGSCKKSSPSQAAAKRLAAETLGSLGFSNDCSCWSRIKILDWRTEENDDLIRVFYVDRGDSGLLSLRRTMLMDGTLANYPAFTQKCYLSSIAPINGEWSEEDRTVFEIFTESTEKKCHMKMEITEKNGAREDGAIGVKLFVPESRACINEKLVEYGIAVAKKHDTEDGYSKRSGDIPLRYLPAFAVGEEIPVKVTCIVRVNHIFCVKDYEKTDESDVLMSLIMYLNNPETISGMSPLEKTPSIGELVVAKYEDDLWYRAEVVKSNSDSSTFRVKFLDYGNTETVSMKEMRKMESEFLKIPFQMVECLLENVKLRSKADPQKAVKYLNEKVAEHTTIRIERVLDGVRSLYGVRIFDKCGEDIAAQLISAGQALSCSGTD